MDGVKISDIPGALVEKKNRYDGNATIDGYIHAGFNDAIDQQGQVRLSLSRGKLAIKIFDIDMGYSDIGILDRVILNYWNKCDHKGFYYKRADTIIANQKDLFEVVK